MAPMFNLIVELIISNLDFMKMDFDATVSHSTAMSEDKSISLKTEWGYSSTEHKIDDLVNAFNHQSFTNRSANLREKLYKPDDSIFQHIPIREKVGKIGVNSLRDCKLTHTLNSDDF